jgi:cell division protein FtsI/penicillin-binding protein 2
MADAIRRAGFAHPPEGARIASYLAETGFGQVTIKVAPVELAAIAAAVGMSDGGSGAPGAARPVWVRKVTDERGRDVRLTGLPGMATAGEFRPFDPEAMGALREMMLAVVNAPGGTAYGAFHARDGQPRLPGIEVGGKTGTAEYDREIRTAKGRALSRRKHVWFVGFARRPDRFPPPTLAFAVLVEDAKGSVTGGRVCAPLARDLIERVLIDEPATPAAASEPGGNGALDRAVDRARDMLEEFGRRGRDQTIERVRGALEELGR